MAPKNLTAIFEFISKIVSFLFFLLSLPFPFLFLLSPVILSFSFETDRGGAEKTHKELFEMTVKNVDCKQEPIENPFSFQ